MSPNCAENIVRYLHMKKLLAIVILGLLWCNTSFAGWTKVATTAGTGDTTVYIDKKTIKKIGDKVIYKQLTSYKEPLRGSGGDVYSDIAVLEVNCTNNQARFLDNTYYSGKMGSGSVIAEDDSVSDWDYFAPGSVMGIVMKYVCK